MNPAMALDASIIGIFKNFWHRITGAVKGLKQPPFLIIQSIYSIYVKQNLANHCLKWSKILNIYINNSKRMQVTFTFGWISKVN